MSGYLLDTNILSASSPERVRLGAEFGEWLQARQDQLYLSVISVLEIEAGIGNLRRKGAKARAAALDQWLTETMRSYGTRILELDVTTARLAGAMADRVKAAGYKPELADVVIAATAEAHQLLILTANTRHFSATGVPHLNPFLTLPKA